jgi:hypothetical protein
LTCGEKNGAHNSNALSDDFGLSERLSLARSGAGIKDSEGRHNMGDLVAADPADHASVHIHHLKQRWVLRGSLVVADAAYIGHADFCVF